MQGVFKTCFCEAVGETDDRETEQGLKKIQVVLRTLYEVWQEKKSEEAAIQPQWVLSNVRLINTEYLLGAERATE